MKIKYEFDPWEDKEELLMHRNAHKMCILIHEFEQYLRKIDKHSEFGAAEQSMLERIRNKWFEYKIEGVGLNDDL